MSAPVYVIREGKVRGQGKYLQSSVVGPPWGDSQGAARFDSRERAHDWIELAARFFSLAAARFFSMGAASLDLDPKCARIVRVVVKPRQVVSLAHHIVCVATARLAALDEAEQACLEERRRCNMHASWGMSSGARNCVAAIAALKVLP